MFMVISIDKLFYQCKFFFDKLNYAFVNGVAELFVKISSSFLLKIPSGLFSSSAIKFNTSSTKSLFFSDSLYLIPLLIASLNAVTTFVPSLAETT